MAQYEGKTPEQLAAEIIKKAVEPVLIEVSGVAGQNLELVLRYKYARKIYSDGEKWFRDNQARLTTEWLEGIIESQYEQRRKADAKQAEADKWAYATMLQSRGWPKLKAMQEAGLITEEDIVKPVAQTPVKK